MRRPLSGATHRAALPLTPPPYRCIKPGCRYAHAESISGASLHLVAADPASAATDDPGCHAGPTPPTTVVGELPRCPACSSPSLPQALL